MDYPNRYRTIHQRVLTTLYSSSQLHGISSQSRGRISRLWRTGVPLLGAQQCSYHINCCIYELSEDNGTGAT
ncbi:MAG: hypothetical protein HWQ43_18570 [Nostoc sp. JL31]|uniref:hypothetical protein n=1 Tax=Nostoc sp. JL31 TaxID=2815395 RepID=UPI0025E115E3|nr:hypothetical protein [Nostoc sp. JL31]MBN3891062.1 hypothetical protein [Nostoc sp. JL31]